MMWDKLKAESMEKLKEHLGMEFETIIGTFHRDSPRNAFLWLMENH